MAIQIPPFGQRFDEFGRPINPSVMPSLNPFASQVPPTAAAPVRRGPITTLKVNPTPVPPPPSPLSPVTQPVMPKRPEFSEVDLTRPDLTPAQIEMLTSVPPDIANYEPSRKRSVLAAIAGGFAGAAGGPKVGYEMGQQIRYAPYMQAQREYGQEQERLKGVQDIEKQRFLEAKTREELGVRQDIASGVAAIREGQLQNQLYANQLKERHLGVQEDYIRARTQRQYGLMREAEEKMAQKRISAEYLYFTGTDDEREGVIEYLKAKGAAGKPELDQIAAKAFASEQGRMEFYRLHPELYKEKAGSLAGGRVAGTAEEQLKEPFQKALRIRKEIEQKAKFTMSDVELKQGDNEVAYAKSHPYEAWRSIYKINNQRVKAYVISRFSSDEMEKFKRFMGEADVRTHGDALTALGHLNNIEMLFEEEPRLWNEVGPLMGRLSEAELKAGQVYHADPEIAAKLSEMRTLMANFLTFESKVQSGGRPSWQLMEYLKKSSPGLQYNRRELEGLLAGARKSIGSRAAGLEGEVMGARPVPAKNSPANPPKPGAAAPGPEEPKKPRPGFIEFEEQ